MTNHRLFFWLRWLLALASLVAGVPQLAAAAPLDDALDALASDDRERLEPALGALGGIDDPRALATLKAAGDGKLRVAPPHGVFIQSAKGLIDLRTGTPATAPAGIRELTINNRVRKQLTVALARAELR